MSPSVDQPVLPNDQDEYPEPSEEFVDVESAHTQPLVSSAGISSTADLPLEVQPFL